MKLLLLFLNVFFLILPLCAKEALSIDYWNEIEKTIQETGFNGTIVVGRGDQVLLHKSVGYTDKAKIIPLTAKHLFSPGSVGKEFTTVSIMQLAAKNKLKYQDSIKKYVAGLPEWTNKITIEHILTHTSGLPDVKCKKGISTADAIQQIQQGTLAFEPGTSYKYTNLNVVVRALIVESITGQSYADYIDSSIFKVAGMTYAFHQTENEQAPKTVVPGDFPTNMAGLTIYVTPLDLFNFENALWNGSLLNTEQLKQALPGDSLSGQTNRAYFDFGKFLVDENGSLVSWEHDGSNPSHHTIKHHDFISGNVFILMSSDGSKSTLYKLLNELKVSTSEEIKTTNLRANKSMQPTANASAD
ncbi:CubicO group peptidase (beta-lactamase class C family) [Rheinheimera pacifica]|uniref:serine hydrolase domain-containing protein n=1 Tax=Rheinheimera pacifica TaxID=173990 RepID=UPI00285C9F02|nr:serine hydrolase domain-containing protein [Rheinheimera pacifica]MDR6985467.1 CubicO group peptidase (beta-lactamase class C family) [Rheinheimera pacifica]